jgi:hypothetical protein
VWLSLWMVEVTAAMMCVTVGREMCFVDVTSD